MLAEQIGFAEVLYQQPQWYATSLTAMAVPMTRSRRFCSWRRATFGRTQHNEHRLRQFIKHRVIILWVWIARDSGVPEVPFELLQARGVADTPEAAQRRLDQLNMLPPMIETERDLLDENGHTAHSLSSRLSTLNEPKGNLS